VLKQMRQNFWISGEISFLFKLAKTKTKTHFPMEIPSALNTP
jgi:hypothetical protein